MINMVIRRGFSAKVRDFHSDKTADAPFDQPGSNAS
jgi:hypothetical protein